MEGEEEGAVQGNFGKLAQLPRYLPRTGLYRPSGHRGGTCGG